MRISTQRREIKRPPVSSLNVPMLFYDMAGSEVTYSPLMLSYRQEDFGYTVCNYSGFNIKLLTPT